MIKHAGRKYSIPTKPKKASKQTAAGRSAAVRRRVTAFLEKRAQPRTEADYTQVSSPAQLLLIARPLEYTIEDPEDVLALLESNIVRN